MAATPPQSTILVVGNDAMLSYLLRRYTEQSGQAITFYEKLPSLDAFDRQQPAAIIFLSIEQLREAQGLMEAPAWHEIPILVCAAVAEEAQTRELGADACLLHPLTYENFLAAIEQ